MALIVNQNKKKVYNRSCFYYNGKMGGGIMMKNTAYSTLYQRLQDVQMQE